MKNHALLLFFMFVSFKGYCQNESSERDTIFYIGNKLRFSYNDTITKQFFDKNYNCINEINKAIVELPIDWCRHKSIQALVLVDSLGVASKIKILTGSGFQKSDQLIIDKIMSFKNKWIAAIAEGYNVPFIAQLTFAHYDEYPKYVLPKKFGTNDNVTIITQMIPSPKIACEDSEYYSKQGTQKFQEGDFKNATKLYLKALEYNKYDVDVNFNLAVSYLKSGDKVNACKYFSKCEELGDTGVDNLLKKHCSD